MVNACDVDFNSPWALLPQVRGPTGLPPASDTSDSVAEESMDLDSMPSIASAEGAAAAAASSVQLCSYCHTLNWGKLYGQLSNRRGMTMKPSFGEMLRRRSHCKLCALLTTCIKDVNEGVQIDPSNKVILQPIGSDRKQPYLNLYALGANVVDTRAKLAKKGRVESIGLNAGTLSVSIHEDHASSGPAYLRNSIAGREVRQPRDLSVVKKWLRTCQQTHEECKDNKMYRTTSMTFANDSHPKKTLPRRTIFIPEDVDSEKVFLQEHFNGEREDYLTLSYCWGPTGSMIQTTSKNLQDHLREGFNISELPRTFRDAIHMTRSLGVRHLWIDALCIIQDDKVEWAKSAKLMGQVYAGGLLTIAALSSTHADGGLYFERSLNAGAVSIPYLPGSDGSGVQVQIASTPSVQVKPRQLEDEAHSQRAWTLQERLLSSRVIYCAELQYYWECRKGKSVEDGSPFPEGITQTARPRSGSLIGSLATSKGRTEALDLWYEIVRTYSWRGMKFEQDKLFALEGLVKTFASYIHAPYLNGIWETDLAQALAWRRSRRCERLTIPETLRAPSWSWAAYDGGLNYLNQRVYHNHSSPAWKSLLEHPQYLRGDIMTEIRVSAMVYTDPSAQTIDDLLDAKATCFLDDGSESSSKRSEAGLSCLALARVRSDPNRAHVLLLARNYQTDVFTRIGLADVRSFPPLLAKMSRRQVSLV